MIRLKVFGSVSGDAQKLNFVGYHHLPGVDPVRLGIAIFIKGDGVDRQRIDAAWHVLRNGWRDHVLPAGWRERRNARMHRKATARFLAAVETAG